MAFLAAFAVTGLVALAVAWRERTRVRRERAAAERERAAIEAGGDAGAGDAAPTPPDGVHG